MRVPMAIELTEAEQFFDDVVKQQRTKGRRTYGSGLDWSDGDGPDATYDWRQMALEEAVDLNQYLCAEILRHRFRIKHLEQALAETERSSDITFRQYQSDAMRTATNESDREELAVRALGLAGEAGEVVELVKKYLGHGHDFERNTLEKELGDVLWYVAALTDAAGLDLAAVAQKNIQKLKIRYPDGFSQEASRNRSD